MFVLNNTTFNFTLVYYTLQIIQNFLKYLEEWQSVATEKNYKCFHNKTFYGLKVSLKATLEICQYLIENCGFSYIMTARLNQDSLEVRIFYKGN